MNIKESCYLGNLETVGYSAERGIKGACKYEQVKPNLKQEKLVHKCGVSQESVKISVKKTVNKTPGQHSSRTDMIHKVPALQSLLQEGLLNTLSSWCCRVCSLMFAHSGFPFYVKDL